ncbi:hypothetical protein [Paenibacillus alvei]|uniref:hypothetical protein n=1 Tax=Paenibacillus alvei TaxID=44250 RepID=UPI0022810C9B|nr:hypothetical protein [Paenibacillus alvei]
MPREYKLITAGTFAGQKRMKLHYLDIDTDQVLCGSLLSGYETQPREGVRVCKRCEAAYRRRGGTLLQPVDTDALLANTYPGLMEDFIEEEITEKISVIKEGHLVENIIGRWSADAVYAPGAMEDTEIVFKPNGDGWLCFLHPFSTTVEKFKWEIDNRCLMQIKGTTSTLHYDIVECDELSLENYYDKPSDMIFRDLKVEINIEFTPRGNNEVITFSEPLFLSDNRFALVHRDITKLEPPSFV